MKSLVLIFTATVSVSAFADFNETVRRAYEYHHSAEYQQKVQAEEARDHAQIAKLKDRAIRVYAQKYHHGLVEITGADQYGKVNFSTRDNRDCQVQVDPMVQGWLFHCISKATFETRTDIMSDSYLNGGRR